MKKASYAVLLTLFSLFFMTGAYAQTENTPRQEYVKVLNSYSSGFVYSTYDINKDGIPELFVKTGNCEAEYKYYVYAIIDGTAQKIHNMSGSHVRLYTFPSDNGVIIWWSNQAWNISKLVFDGKDVAVCPIASGGMFDVYDYDSLAPNSEYIKEYNFDFSRHGTITDSLGIPIIYDYHKELIETIKHEVKCGNYLEAIESCANANKWYALSPDVMKQLEVLCNIAKDKYGRYKNGTLYFYDATDEVNQIQAYFSSGLYLEAMNLCKDTLQYCDLSPSDYILIDDIKRQSRDLYISFLQSHERLYKFADSFRTLSQ